MMKLRSFYRVYNRLTTIGYVQVGTNHSNSSFKSPNSYCCPKLVTNSIRFSSDLQSAKCWRCNNPNKSAELLCSKCKALQELPENSNYFQIIGVKEDYDIKNTEIRDKYRRLQSLLHPDKFSNSTEKEKELSGNLSSLVNKAYSTLLHPLQRGLYMLKLKNMKIPEETTSLNPEFLMKIMEKNEEVQAASEDAVKTLKLIRENREILEDYSRQVSAAFQKKDVEQAKKILVKMKYYASIEAKLKTLKQSLGIVE